MAKISTEQAVNSKLAVIKAYVAGYDPADPLETRQFEVLDLQRSLAAIDEQTDLTPETGPKPAAA